MAVRIVHSPMRLTVSVSGEIDHHNAAVIRYETDEAIQSSLAPCVRIDFGEVTFMDSSGIGLVMGRYKLIKSLGGEIRAENLSPSAYKIMHLAGVERLGEIRQREAVK